MNALAYQTQNSENILSVASVTDISRAYINTLVPNFTYKDQFGLQKSIKAENQLRL